MVLLHTVEIGKVGNTHFWFAHYSNLCFIELNYVRVGCQSDIQFEGIKKMCEFLSSIAKINDAIKRFDKKQFLNVASAPNSNIDDVNFAYVDRYLFTMQKALKGNRIRI